MEQDMVIRSWKWFRSIPLLIAIGGWFFLMAASASRQIQGSENCRRI
jgi:hypothetical protein